jgi:hypothetical protein
MVVTRFVRNVDPEVDAAGVDARAGMPGANRDTGRGIGKPARRAYN